MAITAAELQTALGTGIGDPRVLIAYEPSQGTQQQWYVDGRITVPGRIRFCNTTAANNAATQAAAVLTQLKA
jgi:hypothetical protein